MAIHSVYKLDGSVTTKVVCGNTSCDSVLQEWEGSENEQDWESRYILISVESKVFYVDKYGQPLKVVPKRQPFQILGADILLNLKGRLVGYTIAPSVFLEDFCSNQCARQFLEANPEYGLCMYRQSNSGTAFVADSPDRFRTVQVQVDLP